jgi:DNA-binding response OmpR family regulator
MRRMCAMLQHADTGAEHTQIGGVRDGSNHALFDRVTGKEKAEARTVLVVDDEPHVRDVVARVLLQQGYKVLEAANGPAALQLIDTGQQWIDLVIVDLVMPHQSGGELARSVRARRRNASVIFMSAYPSSITLPASFGQDIPVLQKPFSKQELIETVRRVLR